ncbi:MAG TPA: efflux RND transporter periplasmic adaptor subunit [Anaeromyxobacteraceae bacterium]|nr:efflux RND transporter periplasmic adaptor subunit [Anaeromyxobacteraceae bacterium]
MSWPKRLLAFAFIVAVAGVLAASLYPRKDPPLAVQLAKVRRASITRKVTAAGKLQAATQVKLSSNLSGDLLDLPVREGDAVAKGQYLGKIDSRRYEAQVLQREALEKSARSELSMEEVNLAKLEAELVRVARLVKADGASAAELERATSERDGALARVQAAKDRVSNATASLAEARYLLSFTTLTAPIDGIITSRLKQVGERVRGSDFNEDPIVIIATLSSMEVKVEVGEHEVVFLRVGDPAEVEIDAIPDKKWPAQVVEIAKNANIRNPGTEQEVTTFPVRLALTVPVPGALPGMSAQASVSTETHDRALVVPLQAVTVRPEKDILGAPGEKGPDPGLPEPGQASRPRREAMRKVVFAVEKGEAHARTVETGLASESEVEIASGLSEGQVVVEGPYKVLARELSDGRAVRELKPGEKPRVP